MTRAIGAASDFYRLRMMRVDDAETPEFEWREDVLWRTLEARPLSEAEVCRVEAVSLDDRDRVVVIGTFDSLAEAHEALDSAEEELEELTRSEFEERYFPVDA